MIGLSDMAHAGWVEYMYAIVHGVEDDDVDKQMNVSMRRCSHSLTKACCCPKSCCCHFSCGSLSHTITASSNSCCVQVSYRYNVVRARMQLLQSRLADINAMVGGGWGRGSTAEGIGWQACVIRHVIQSRHLKSTKGAGAGLWWKI